MEGFLGAGMQALFLFLAELSFKASGKMAAALGMDSAADMINGSDTCQWRYEV